MIKNNQKQAQTIQIQAMELKPGRILYNYYTDELTKNINE
jgi:hypothetical protein